MYERTLSGKAATASAIYIILNNHFAADVNSLMFDQPSLKQRLKQMLEIPYIFPSLSINKKVVNTVNFRFNASTKKFRPKSWTKF